MNHPVDNGFIKSEYEHSDNAWSAKPSVAPSTDGGKITSNKIEEINIRSKQKAVYGLVGMQRCVVHKTYFLNIKELNRSLTLF